ncbi:non-structural maintenance of chromosomes element 1 homolog [Nilaparvata lugens]|uniref:non-structural maintenance of chromosomes element 1 homolog n=1 Tax=Nilaparvata lugens TaxID=108931 RepID=UPI00193CF38B|nr:non-structural maintenance of chromosomes element 1 homolog [Nilaparvata lugens]
MAYLDQHKMLLQIFLNRRMMTEEELMDFYLKLFGEDRTADNMADDLHIMNDTIHCLRHKIEKVRCEITGRPLYIYYINHGKNYDSIDRQFSVPEKSLIGHLMQEIVESESGLFSDASVHNLSEKVLVKHGKQVDTVDFMKKLLDRHLLERTDDDLLHMSPLGLKEMEPYLRANFDDLQECQLCQAIIIHGASCQSCFCKVHKHCLIDFTKNRRSEITICPKCDNEFHQS